jgi:hypothetical protein
VVVASSAAVPSSSSPPVREISSRAANTATVAITAVMDPSPPGSGLRSGALGLDPGQAAVPLALSLVRGHRRGSVGEAAECPIRRRT